MLVDLRTLKPNPFRDFTVDPIDPAVVTELAHSIDDDGFWGGMVCRRYNSEIQIGAGHHRRDAALQVGITEADVFVGDFDDAGMIRVYARENATQRGNTGTAMAGSVASALRMLAKGLLTDNVWIYTFAKEHDFTVSMARAHLLGVHGLGHVWIEAFLEKIPGITVNTVRQQLMNLKSSGDYARIIGEIEAEIKHEEQEAAEALARAEEEQQQAEEAARKAENERKAAAERAKVAREEAAHKQAELDRQKAEVAAQLAEKRRKDLEAQAEQLGIKRKKASAASGIARQATSKAEEREISFAFAGVAQHLKNAYQISVFRDVVTTKNIAEILPVNKQGEFAAKIVEAAANWNQGKGAELSGTFIRDHAFDLAMEFRYGVRRADTEAKERAAEQSWLKRWEDLLGEFARQLSALSGTALRLTEFREAHPEINPPLNREFLQDLENAKSIIDRLDRSLKHGKQQPSQRRQPARRALGYRAR